MDEQVILQTMDRQGYFLLPKAHLNSPGYRGLFVAIREEPTGLGYDPQSVRLRIADKSGDPDWETISYKTTLRGAKQVVPGRVILGNHSRERIEFFSFGGQLESISILGAMVYSVSSQAPILELFEPKETVPNQLAFETEGTLARLAARMSLGSKDVIRRLAQVEPMTLYAASVQSILIHYQQSAELRKCFHELYSSLLREKKWLINTSQWQNKATTLDELLLSDDSQITSMISGLSSIGR